MAGLTTQGQRPRLSHLPPARRNRRSTAVSGHAPNRPGQARGPTATPGKNAAPDCGMMTRWPVCLTALPHTGAFGLEPSACRSCGRSGQTTPARSSRARPTTWRAPHEHEPRTTRLVVSPAPAVPSPRSVDHGQHRNSGSSQHRPIGQRTGEGYHIGMHLPKWPFGFSPSAAIQRLRDARDPQTASADHGPWPR